MKKILIYVVRKLTAFAWRHERDVTEGIASLQELHIEQGGMSAEIKIDPALYTHIALCFAEMVAKSPNYTEAHFDWVAKYNPDKWEWVTVLVQKGKGKTPHQLRREAEYREQLCIKESSRCLAMVSELRNLLHHAYIHSNYQDCGFMQMTTPQKTLFVSLLEMWNQGSRAKALKEFISEVL